jgi:hypothetical protein
VPSAAHSGSRPGPAGCGPVRSRGPRSRLRAGRGRDPGCGGARAGMEPAKEASTAAPRAPCRKRSPAPAARGPSDLQATWDTRFSSMAAPGSAPRGRPGRPLSAIPAGRASPRHPSRTAAPPRLPPAGQRSSSCRRSAARRRPRARRPAEGCPRRAARRRRVGGGEGMWLKGRDGGGRADACSGTRPQRAHGQTLFSRSHTSGDAVAAESLFAVACMWRTHVRIQQMCLW